jgi:hypothetical protein
LGLGRRADDAGDKESSMRNDSQWVQIPPGIWVAPAGSYRSDAGRKRNRRRSSLESSLQPSYIPNSAWPAVFTNLTAEFGSTTASYLSALDNEATALSQLGEYTDDVQRLFGFAINTANDAGTTGSIDSVTDASFPVPGAIPLEFDRQFNASISGRDTMGPFGLGWTDNWQISASADSAGTSR